MRVSVGEEQICCNATGDFHYYLLNMWLGFFRRIQIPIRCLIDFNLQQDLLLPRRRRLLLIKRMSSRGRSDHPDELIINRKAIGAITHIEIMRRTFNDLCLLLVLYTICCSAFRDYKLIEPTPNWIWLSGCNWKLRSLSLHLVGHRRG